MSIPGNTPTDQMWQLLGRRPSLTTLKRPPKEYEADYNGGYRVHFNARGHSTVSFRDVKGWHEHTICGVTDPDDVYAFRIKDGQYTLVLIRNKKGDYANLYVFRGGARLTAISAHGATEFGEVTGNRSALEQWGSLRLAKEMVRDATLGGDDVCRLEGEGGGGCP